ncbi:MAG TPA: alternative ribosome rescue aminoacyl-tRNA hydrolase ArfB [Phycisphaerae bacterium]|nr:alternative ribosome rescue aminoacyl-tRNA hydrolase ArfB [Phycisphaerae bacterium]
MIDSPAEELVINAQVRIRTSELRFVFSRSPGPGGQNVNKSNTRVTLLFDVGQTEALSPAQRSRVHRRLATRIDREGTLRVVSSRHRTQMANRRAAVSRFVELMADALTVRKKRVKTRVPRRAVERRLQDKTRSSQLKRLRRARPSADD